MIQHIELRDNYFAYFPNIVRVKHGSRRISDSTREGIVGHGYQGKQIWRSIQRG